MEVLEAGTLEGERREEVRKRKKPSRSYSFNFTTNSSLAIPLQHPNTAEPDADEKVDFHNVQQKK